jgi:hypothetical protein
MWGDYGMLVLGHEYGHAVQDLALGGLPIRNCPSPHYFEYDNNDYGCAYSKGFASFHAMLTLGSQLDSYFTAGNGTYFQDTFVQGGDGASWEGAVWATLWDFVDNDAEGSTR